MKTLGISEVWGGGWGGGERGAVVLAGSNALEAFLTLPDNKGVMYRRRYYLALLRRLPLSVSGPAIFWQMFNPSYGRSLIIGYIPALSPPQDCFAQCNPGMPS